MPTIVEQSDAINRDLEVLRKRDDAHPILSMLAQWSAELSIRNQCQVVVTIVPIPGKPGETGLLAYPLLNLSAIESKANRDALAAIWPSQQSGEDK